MSRAPSTVVWALLAVVSVPVLVWAFPRAFPFYPSRWTVSQREATALGLERAADLAPLPADPYLVTRLRVDPGLEQRVAEAAARLGVGRLRGSRPAREIAVWEVSVFPPGARSDRWSHRVLITPDGEVTGAVLQLPADQPAAAADPAELRRRADAVLAARGLDLAAFAEPEVRSRQQAQRTDHEVLYRDRQDLLGEGTGYGYVVKFAGDRLTAYDTFYGEAGSFAPGGDLQLLILVNQAWVFLPVPLLPIVGFFFLRRYHQGEIGVRRGLQVLGVSLASGLVVIFLCARAMAAQFGIGLLTPAQATALIATHVLLFFFGPVAMMAFLSWSVGEPLTRERAGHRLAAFDALLRLDWANSTFAHASLRGLAAGLALVAALWALVAATGAQASLLHQLGGWWPSAQWFALPLLGMVVAYGLYAELFGRLLLPAVAVGRFGTVGGGVLAAVAGALLLVPPVMLTPIAAGLPLWLLFSGVLVALFLRYGIYTALAASITTGVVGSAYPMLGADDPSIQVQAALALVAVALPFLVSVRHLAGGRELVYRYEDVPPHVRRIAERERQRVELETARRIQSSILPELPARLGGVDLAHAYLPATEVGGDFYDVLALADGRLAVAVGDVAGHGVSSGLVMSMVHSALAVQVTFDPRVEAVFATLNRMVYQTAGKRLLATLCYALLDPVRRELLYASAGHLFPYRLGSSGRAEALESVAYPLGVRDTIEVTPRSARLAAGDLLFLCSDGVVEARRDGADEPFGFARLEASLECHAPGGVGAVREGVLADLGRFAGSGPREDDQTLLVLKVP